MELKIQKNDLLNAINTASKATATKSTLSILECLLFTVENDEIRITSCDTEIEIDTYCEGEIVEDGKICVDSKVFCPIIAKLPDGEVSIKTNETTMTLKCGRSKFNIPVRSGDEYPSMESVKQENGITLGQGELKDIIRQTIFSISQNDNNKLMTGCLFNISNNTLKVVALDGHRIAIREKELGKDYEDVSVIIPGKTLQNILKIVGEGDIDIYFADNMAAFKFDNTLVTSRLIEGEYFDINRMMNNEYSTTVTVNNSDFSACLERSLLLINSNDKKPVVMDISDNKIETSVTANLGSLSETVEVITEGQDIRIGMNPAFVLDALRVIDDEEVNLHFTGEKAPMYIKGEGYIYLILPVQVR